jgi:hypothetical protein
MPSFNSPNGLNYDFNRADKISVALSQEYPIALKESSINGIVLNKYLPSGFRQNPYYARIMLDDYKKIGIEVFLSDDQNSLHDYLKVGSLLTKHGNSDTLYILNFQSGDSTLIALKLKFYDE